MGWDQKSSSWKNAADDRSWESRDIQNILAVNPGKWVRAGPGTEENLTRRSPEKDRPSDKLQVREFDGESNQ